MATWNKGRHPKGTTQCDSAIDHYTPAPGLGNLAALVSSLDRLGTSPSLKLLDQSLGVDKIHGSGESRGSNSLVLRHRRNQAALQMCATRLQKKSDGRNFRIVTSRSYPPILSPEPISPVRQLRVKNSIPRLMKALPPLPGDDNIDGSCLVEPTEDAANFPVSFSSFSLTQLSTPRSTDDGDRKSSHASSKADPPSKCQLKPQPSKLKLRKPPGSSEQRQSSSESHGDGGVRSVSNGTGGSLDSGIGSIKSHVPLKARLRLKTTSPDLNSRSKDDDTGTVRRNSLAGSSVRPLESSLQAPCDLFTHRSLGLERPAAQLRRSNDELLASHNIPERKKPVGAHIAQQAQTNRQLEFIPDACPITPHDEEVPRDSMSTRRLTLTERRSFISEATRTKPHRLRNKLSNLRDQMVRSCPSLADIRRKARSEGTLGNDQAAVETDHTPRLTFTNGGSDPVHVEICVGQEERAREGERPISKMRQWIRGTRQTVSACMKRSLDRASRTD